ncbi:MAG: hypothetical protein HY747_11545 [Elusimicrobia bacterium]|nr:hypothetical protein [Elusimicrobiota bacterium]
MKSQNDGLLSWSVEDIACALKIKVEDVREYFTDGRRISFILERRIMREVLKGKLAPGEGASFDLYDGRGRKWEVRSISRGGVYFCPSYMVGSGRSFNSKGFLEKLAEIEGYVLCDIESFPDVPYWIVPVEQVRQWWRLKVLGTATKISRVKVLFLLKKDH